MRLLSFLLLIGALAALGLPAVAQPAGGEAESAAAKLERWDTEAKRIQGRIEAGDLTQAEIDSMRATLDAQRAAIPELVSAAEAELQPLKQQLEALGPAPEGPGEEAPEIARERERLKGRIAEVEARLKLLSQADARAAALLEQLAGLRRELFTRKLLTRGPSPLEPGVVARAIGSIGAVATEIAGEIAARLPEGPLETPAVLRTALGVLAVVAAVLLLRGARRAMLRRLVRPIDEEAPERHRVIAGIGATLVRLLMPALAVLVVLVAAWNSGLVGPQARTVLRGLAWTAVMVIGAYGLGGAFYSPYAPAFRLSRLPESEAVAAHNWLMGLAVVVGFDQLLVVKGEALGLSIEALSLLNSALLVMGGIAVWGFVQRLREPSPESSTASSEPDEEGDEGAAEQGTEMAVGPFVVGVLRLIGRAVAIIAPVLALTGYFAASRFLFYPVVFSGAVIGVCVLLFHAVQESVDRLVEPAESEIAGAPSRVRLIPVFVGFFLVCAAVPVLALVWGADLTDLSTAWRSVAQGFRVGEVRISPLDFFSFLLVFSIGYVLTRIIQGVLRRSVLPVSGLDEGAKGAISAGVFYVGVTLAALIAIAATGLDLSNLAIVIGALSVGIGFGLQNVVNNFVSGLILLLERPIKPGDWVQITSGMGYVKQIRVRSTEIETFDRQALIVPNSELISSSVINWTHTNLQGRLIVPVHVAYGSDPAKVERVLTEIAKGHTMLLRRPAPFVLFRRFGPDCLEFEIRGYLRDVNWILNVHSEINFEIARRFAEEGIHIPYPQRDLHLRNTEEVASAIRDALHNEGGAEPEEPPSGAPPPRRRRRRPQEPTRGGEGEPDADF